MIKGQRHVINLFNLMSAYSQTFKDRFKRTSVTFVLFCDGNIIQQNNLSETIK